MSVRTSTPGCLRPCRLPARIVLCAVLFAADASAGDADPAASVQPYSSRRTAAAVDRDSRPAQPSGLSAAPRHADRATLVALRAALSEPDSRRRPRRVPAVLPVESFTGGLALDPLSKDAMASQSDGLGHADRFAPGSREERQGDKATRGQGERDDEGRRSRFSCRLVVFSLANTRSGLLLLTRRTGRPLRASLPAGRGWG